MVKPPANPSTHRHVNDKVYLTIEPNSCCACCHGAIVRYVLPRKQSQTDRPAATTGRGFMPVSCRSGLEQKAAPDTNEPTIRVGSRAMIWRIKFHKRMFWIQAALLSSRIKHCNGWKQTYLETKDLFGHSSSESDGTKPSWLYWLEDETSAKLEDISSSMPGDRQTTGESPPIPLSCHATFITPDTQICVEINN